MILVCFTRQALAMVNHAACVTLTMRCLTAINQLVKRKALTMAEYINREEIKRELSEWCISLNNPHLLSRDDTMFLLDNIPAADVAPVVHCKDCKHSTLPSELTQRYGKPGTLTCHNMHAPSNRRNVGSNDFCSYGEREEND